MMKNNIIIEDSPRKNYDGTVIKQVRAKGEVINSNNPFKSVSISSGRIIYMTQKVIDSLVNNGTLIDNLK